MCILELTGTHLGESFEEVGGGEGGREPPSGVLTVAVLGGLMLLNFSHQVLLDTVSESVNQVLYGTVARRTGGGTLVAAS